MQKFCLLVAMLVTMCGPSSFAEEPVKEKKVIEIFLHQDHVPGYKTGFYMWIHHLDITVKNTAPDVQVGYSFGEGGGLYLTTGDTKDAKHLNAMFLVTNYDGKGFPFDVIVWFGGSRPNDINIRLPEGYTAKVHVNNIKWGEQDWKRYLEDKEEAAKKNKEE